MSTLKEYEIRPAEPDAQERKDFYRGRSGTQTARKNKKTGLVQLWYWGNGGHWGQPTEKEQFTIKPTLK